MRAAGVAAVLLGAVAAVLGWTGVRRAAPELEAPPPWYRLFDGRALVFVREGAEAGEPFLIDRYEVTRARYARFLRESGYRPAAAGHADDWIASVLTDRDEPSRSRRPVRFVSLKDAEAFARFVGARLPTFAEWAEAARFVQVRSRFDANVLETGLEGPARVGTFEGGRTSENGAVQPPVYDLFGNVAEWTTTEDGEGRRIVAGGSFVTPLRALTSRPREGEEPANRNFALGFRTVVPGASALVDRLVRRAASDPRARRLLERFGRAGELTLERARFERAVRWSRPDAPYPRLLVRIPEGGTVLVGRDGSIEEIDTEGRTVRRGEVPERVQRVLCADLDSDGSSELYAAGLAAGGRTLLGFLALERSGRLVWISAEDGSVSPWPGSLCGPEEPLGPDSIATWVSGLPALDSADPAGSPVFLAAVSARSGWLARVDRAAGGFETSWIRDAPRIVNLWACAARGEVQAVCEAGVRPGFATVTERLPAGHLFAFAARSGRTLASLQLPCEVTGAVATGDRGGRVFLALGASGRVHLLERRGRGFRAIGRLAQGVVWMEEGPEPAACVWLRRDAAGGWLEARDSAGRLLARRRTTERRLPDLARVPGESVLANLGQTGLLLLDGRLRTVRRLPAGPYDFGRGGPIPLGGREGLYAVPARLDSVAIVDAVGGSTALLRQPGRVVVACVPAPLGVLLDLGEGGVVCLDPSVPPHGPTR